MEKTEIINNEYMGLWYYPESKIVHHKVKKTLPRGAWQELLSTGADYLEKYGAKKWLSDDNEFVILTEEDNEWGEAVWVPRVMEAGFKYWAVVMPKSALGTIQVKRFIKKQHDTGITAEAFGTVDAALAWLESK